MTCENHTIIIKGLSSTARPESLKLMFRSQKTILAFTFYSQVLLPDVPRPAAPTQFKINNSHTLSLKHEQGQRGSDESQFCLSIFSHYH